MTAEIIVHTNVGAPIANAAATTSTGLVWGLYSMTSTENNDWIVISEFSEIKLAICKVVAAGAYADEPITIDATTKNKLVFTGGATGAMKIWVAGIK